MNYYLDFIPSEEYVNKLIEIKDELPDDQITLNIYLKSMPAMNPNKIVYMEDEQAEDYIDILRENGFKINLMLNVFCYGNHEFSETGKDVLNEIDTILKYGIDSVTVTNHFFINYFKRRHPEVPIIASKYAEIENMQKVSRYITNIGVDGVEVDSALSRNKSNMENLTKFYSPKQIHIDMNRLYFNNDIYRESFNNSLSHYISDERWDDAINYINKYRADQESIGNSVVIYSKEDFANNKDLGYTNYWYTFYNDIQADDYLDSFINFVK